MTRQFADGETFLPSESMDGDSVMRAYTSNASDVMGWGSRLGRLAPGQYADLLWLDHDPRTGAKSIADDPMKGMWISGTPVSITR
jgi:imidazolonepropionase-like amidohydrolase